MSFARILQSECDKNLLLEDNEHRHRNRKGELSHSEIMTILVCYHFGSFANFKHYYLFYIRQHLSDYFPDAVSYNRFVELMPRVFFHMMLFMKIQGFGKCGGISFVDSTMIPVCHNLHRYANKVFKDIVTDGKGTMRWCHGFKLHLLCNDSGEIINFCLTGANVDDRDKRVWTVFAKELYGKVFADRRYIKQALFEELFDRGIHLVHGLRANIVHSRHRSIHNFIMNICAALTAYSFFENKPEALPVHLEKSNQLTRF